MDLVKAILTLMTIFWLWLAVVITFNYAIWHLHWVVALPFSIGVTSALTYLGLIVYEKVQ